MVQKICMFLQKETSHCQKGLVLCPQGPKHYIFGNHFYSKNARKLKSHIFLFFYARKLWYHHFTRSGPNSQEIVSFFSFVGVQGPELNWNKFTISCEFGTLQVKWWYHMFSSIEMEKYMESELSGIFRVKLIAKNIVLGSSGTHFTHMRVKMYVDRKSIYGLQVVFCFY